MCGIIGFCDFNKGSNKQILKKMTDTLHHRGPDDSGYSFYENNNVQIGLGHRRLSILDLTKHGHQPMQFQNLEIIYNGEVYNFREIRKELETFGYTFHSDSDTEVILSAYHKWGVRCVDKLTGMFAIAIYDKELEKLVLVRDRAGVKPLYYYFKNGLFLVASELKPFHEHSQFEKEIDLNSLSLYLQFGYVPQPYSIFKHTHKLESGNYLELDLKTQKYNIYKYWDIIECYNQPKIDISEDDALTETEKILKKAYKYRMVSDVPVGVFLSGGYDSSSVAALLQAESPTKLNTFTIGVEDKRLNEAPFAKEIANYLGTNHTEYYCTPKDVKEIFPLLPDIYDEPFGDSSAIPTTLVSKVAKEQVKVVLSADGGDETFGGYVKYAKIFDRIKKVQSIPTFARVSFVKLLESINPNAIPFTGSIRDFKSRYNRVLKYMSDIDPIHWSKNASSHFTENELYLLLKKEYLNLGTEFDRGITLNISNDDFSKMLATDYITYQVDDILTKVDRATMSQSIEGREPMIDHNIVEWVSRLDTSLKYRNNELKYLLKAIVHKHIPKKIMERPKMGFGIPVYDWLKDDLREYILTYLDEKELEKQDIFDVKEIVKLRDSYLLGNRENINQIWILLMFQLWYKKWM